MPHRAHLARGQQAHWPQEDAKTPSSFGKRVEAVRLARDMSQSELARRSRCGAAMINAIEKGRMRGGKRIPVNDVMSALCFRISDALQVSARWLVWGTGPVGKWEPLADDEREILNYYRELTPELRDSARTVLMGLRGASPGPSASFPFRPPKK